MDKNKSEKLVIDKIMKLEEINNLIEILKDISLPKAEKNIENFFDICGFPHYENVVSNVLAYFFRKSIFSKLIFKFHINFVGTRY